MSSGILPPAPGGGPVGDAAVADHEVLDVQLKGGFWRDVFRRLRRNPTAWIGAAIVLLFLLVASTPVSQLADWRFVLCTTGATATSFALGFLNGKIFAKATTPEATIQAFVASYSNIGYMGPGLTLALLGAAAAAVIVASTTSDVCMAWRNATRATVTS